MNRLNLDHERLCNWLQPPTCPTMLPLPLNPHTNHPFHLQNCLEGRQDFRWRKLPNAYHSVVLNGNLIHIRQAEDRLTYRSTPDADLTGLLRSYFRLDDDLDAIYTRDRRPRRPHSQAHTKIPRRPPHAATRPLGMPRLLHLLRESRPTKNHPPRRDDCNPTGPPANPRTARPATPSPTRRPSSTPARPTATNDPRLPARPPRHHPGRQSHPRRQPRPTPPRPTRHPLRRSHLPPNRPLLRRPQRSPTASHSSPSTRPRPSPSTPASATTVKRLYPSHTRSTDDQIISWAQDLFGPHAGYANQFLYMA